MQIDTQRRDKSLSQQFERERPAKEARPAQETMTDRDRHSNLSDSSTSVYFNNTRMTAQSSGLDRLAFPSRSILEWSGPFCNYRDGRENKE
jgi:hypothetical protein